ncbi:MAG: histidine kinase, partial [Gemmatimonadetes bacterium]|nr:histidine kinase [Gemmatimonadota bacterium]
EGPTAIVEVGPLPPGRRLLSDDVALLDRVGTMLARRLDAQRVARERHARDLREKEILQLAAESELRALRAQLNPHFLFNALTTIGYLVQAAPERALGTLYRLTDLLRAVIRGPAGDRVPLGEELAIVESYLAIERERFQERLQVVIDVPEPLREAQVPPLLLQPLVENAIKHGISPLRRGGTITIRARIARQADGTAELVILVADTGAGLGAGGSQTAGTGVGVSNIRQRLVRLFGERASLGLSGAPDQGTTAALRLPVDPAWADDVEEPAQVKLPNAS